MKFSVWPDMCHAPSEVFDTARWAEAVGMHGVWYADHYMPDGGDVGIEPDDVYECWAMLPAIAALTERVRVGSLVSPTTVHHPAVLANRASTIDHISNGRMVLGIGAGWQVREHDAYGIELEQPARRVGRFEEAVQIIRSLLAEPRTTFEGDVYTITDAPCDPAPIQTPLPILVGTKSPRMMRITARFADEWNTWGDVDLATERRAMFNAACEAVGRNPAGMWTSVQALIDLDGDAGSGELPPTLRGSSQFVVDSIGRLADLGFDEFIVPDFNLGDSPTARREGLERINDEVLAQLA